MPGFRERLLRWLRDHSGGRGAAVATRLHTAGVYASGHGTAGLGVDASGERRVVELLAGRESPVVFDVGAHEGEYALMARRILGDGATIYCFEPNPVVFERLKAHAGLVAHQVAVAKEAGGRTLYADPSMLTMASLEPRALHQIGHAPTAETPVEAITLDDFCAGQGIERVDLLKIDVEGVELEVLLGATGLLEHRPIVQFEFGYANVASRTFLRNFFDLLGDTHVLHRVAPRGLIALGTYRLELEVFVWNTNYVAIPRVRTGITVS